MKRTISLALFSLMSLNFAFFSPAQAAVYYRFNIYNNFQSYTNNVYQYQQPSCTQADCSKMTFYSIHNGNTLTLTAPITGTNPSVEVYVGFVDPNNPNGPSAACGFIMSGGTVSADGTSSTSPYAQAGPVKSNYVGSKAQPGCKPSVGVKPAPSSPNGGIDTYYTYTFEIDTYSGN